MNDAEHYDRWKELLISSFDQFVHTLGAYLPSLFGALIIMVLGVVLAWISRWLIIRLGASLDRITQRLGFLSHALQLRWPVSRITANIVYWVIILFFITAAAESLGLPGLAEWLGNLIVYLPSFLIAMFIIWVGFVLGALARDKVRILFAGIHSEYADKLADTARLFVVILTVVIGLGQTGINVHFIEQLFIILFAAIVLALALAFGLGAGPAVTNIIAVRNLRKHYRTGQRVRVRDMEGEILELSKTVVILDTASGRAMIPARIFQEEASLLLDVTTG